MKTVHRRPLTILHYSLVNTRSIVNIFGREHLYDKRNVNFEFYYSTTTQDLMGGAKTAKK